MKLKHKWESDDDDGVADVVDSSGDEKALNDEAATISEEVKDVDNLKHKKSRSVSRLVQKPE